MSPDGSGDERDYLVIYEEPDPYGLPSDDTLVLDIEESNAVRPEVDVRQKLDTAVRQKLGLVQGEAKAAASQSA